MSTEDLEPRYRVSNRAWSAMMNLVAAVEKYEAHRAGAELGRVNAERLRVLGMLVDEAENDLCLVILASENPEKN